MNFLYPYKMEPNIHIISEFPVKHNTIIERAWDDSHSIFYYINGYMLFRFYPYNSVCYFINYQSIDKIIKILKLNPNDYITWTSGMMDGIKLNNFDEIKKLINNHTLSDEEKIAFKDFLYEPEFKLKFVD
jgi:hypothetical protein